MRDGGQVVDEDALRNAFARWSDIMKIKIRTFFMESSHSVHVLHVDVPRSTLLSSQQQQQHASYNVPSHSNSRLPLDHVAHTQSSVQDMQHQHQHGHNMRNHVSQHHAHTHPPQHHHDSASRVTSTQATPSRSSQSHMPLQSPSDHLPHQQFHQHQTTRHSGDVFDPFPPSTLERGVGGAINNHDQAPPPAPAPSVNASALMDDFLQDLRWGASSRQQLSRHLNKLCRASLYQAFNSLHALYPTPLSAPNIFCSS
jgi:hypothetical protein